MRKYIHNKSVCLIPDVHQNIKWVDGIIQKMNKEVSTFVLMGDLFDPRSDNVASLSETARYFSNLKKRLKERLVVLVGNHDQPYYAACVAGRFDDILRNCCSGFDSDRGREVAKILDDSFVRSAQLCVMVNEYLVSHAGVIGKHFHRVYTGDNFDKEATLNQFFQYCDCAWNDFPKYSPLLAVGSARGGYTQPGLTWCDWYGEFNDDIFVPQIVGHTMDDEPIARIKGNSMCIDSRQKLFAVSTPTEFRTEVFSV